VEILAMREAEQVPELVDRLHLDPAQEPLGSSRLSIGAVREPRE
jgi:hypothetical protein